eukprot:TRINITY_DN5062_c3_g1_i1.p1 TRINITY_DN5062_c3_g1~~TRINITY_DN5062_c3_g1_i1.p1  ORF type:complete len:835 (-),score=120.03 TRINITY_DN5062_c3_g1_i1:81-2354(-)
MLAMTTLCAFFVFGCNAILFLKEEETARRSLTHEASREGESLCSAAAAALRVCEVVQEECEARRSVTFAAELAVFSAWQEHAQVLRCAGETYERQALQMQESAAREAIMLELASCQEKQQSAVPVELPTEDSDHSDARIATLIGTLQHCEETERGALAHARLGESSILELQKAEIHARLQWYQDCQQAEQRLHSWRADCHALQKLREQEELARATFSKGASEALLIFCCECLKDRQAVERDLLLRNEATVFTTMVSDFTAARPKREPAEQTVQPTPEIIVAPAAAPPTVLAIAIPPATVTKLCAEESSRRKRAELAEAAARRQIMEQEGLLAPPRASPPPGPRPEATDVQKPIVPSPSAPEPPAPCNTASTVRLPVSSDTEASASPIGAVTSGDDGDWREKLSRTVEERRKVKALEPPATTPQSRKPRTPSSKPVKPEVEQLWLQLRADRSRSKSTESTAPQATTEERPGTATATPQAPIESAKPQAEGPQPEVQKPPEVTGGSSDAGSLSSEAAALYAQLVARRGTWKAPALLGGNTAVATTAPAAAAATTGTPLPAPPVLAVELTASAESVSSVPQAVPPPVPAAPPQTAPVVLTAKKASEPTLPRQNSISRHTAGVTQPATGAHSRRASFVPEDYLSSDGSDPWDSDHDEEDHRRRGGEPPRRRPPQLELSRSSVRSRGDSRYESNRASPKRRASFHKHSASSSRLRSSTLDLSDEDDDLPRARRNSGQHKLGSIEQDLEELRMNIRRKLMSTR